MPVLPTKIFPKKTIMLKPKYFFSGLLIVGLSFIVYHLPRAWAGEPPTALGTPLLIREGEVQSAYLGCGGESAPLINGNYEQQVVYLVNLERGKANLPPLKRANELVKAARYYATDMGRDNYFAPAHDCFDREANGNLVKQGDMAQRIRAYYPYQVVAENIAAGYPTPEDVLAGWLNSSGHLANILNPEVWETGAGYFEGSGDYYRYWVQDFGRRAGVYPLIINNEATETDSMVVSLYIYGNWQEIRLRNDNGSWGDWQPFPTDSTLSWILKNIIGERLVTAEMRNGTQTATSSDTIYLTNAVSP